MGKGSSPSSFEARLPAELESAVTARRLLTGAVAAWSLGDAVRADGSLAISELVTNAVLHAGTDVHVRIARLGSGIRIEVGDGSRRMPVVDAARPEDLLSNRSMTGRGLALIAATCDRWGAEPRDGGKVTWAELGTGQRVVASAPPPAYPPVPVPAPLPAAAIAEGVLTTEAVTGGGRRVRLVGVPVALVLESARQLADLHREMQVMSMGRGTPPEIDEVIQAGRPWVGDIDIWSDVDRRIAEVAASRGEETIDYEVVVPVDVAVRIEGIAGWLRRTASSITRRHLLTLPPSTEVAAFRRWYSQEILEQLSGREPRPCPLRVRAEA